MAQLRSNFGSHPHVKRVFCFDADLNQVSVLWKDQWDQSESIETVSLSQLEAIEPDGRCADVRAEVVRRAGLVINAAPRLVA